MWSAANSDETLAMLHELLPTTTTVGFLENPRNPLSEPRTREVLAAARAIGVGIKILHAGTEGEIDAAFASLGQARAPIVSNDIVFGYRTTQLVALAARYSVATTYTNRGYCLAGGLMSYGYSRADIYRLAGLHVARNLNGEKPADLPVTQTAKIGLVINLKTAETLGLTIPPALLASAEEVIE